jgi:hypothetical protein
MKYSEIKSRDLYFEYLSNKGYEPHYCEGDDPPDIVFKCDGERHAVEVTELHQYIDSEGQEKSRIGFEEAINQICKKAEKELYSNLDRRIDVVISYPLDTEEIKSLYDEILNYVEHFKEKEKILFGRANCWITYSEKDEPGIYANMIPSGYSETPGTKTTTADIQNSINHAINRILYAKIPRLEKLENYDEKVLIIFSMHYFGSVERVQQAIDELIAGGCKCPRLFLVSNETLNEIKT